MALGSRHRRGAPGRVALLAGALAAMLVAPLAAAAPARAPHPALWVVKDADTTIYLFGTFHTLGVERDWLTPKVSKAFSRSSELVLETVVPKSRAEMVAVAAPEAGRSDYLKGEARVMRDGRAKGMSTTHGADQVLRSIAEERGKPVSGLEEFAAQLQTLARIKAAPAPASAVAAPAATPDVTLDQLLTAWRKGDTGAFSDMLAGFKAKAPEAYEVLIAERNRSWADWVRKRLDTPGTVFVAVGSGHLSGEDSVQVRLAERGVRSRRIG